MSMSRDDSVYGPERADDLQAFEAEYRLLLRIHLEDGLGWLDSREDGLPLRAAARRLSEAPDADLARVLADLPEERRQRILTALLRTPVTEVSK
jgi:hypothetical protein